MSDDHFNLTANAGEAAVVPYRSAPVSGEDAPVSSWLGLSPAAWTQMAIVTALMCAVFWPNLRRLWDKTNPFYGEANWGHAVCIPLISLYYLYVNRARLMATPVQALLLPQYDKRHYRFSVAMLAGGAVLAFIPFFFLTSAPLVSLLVRLVSVALIVLGGITHTLYNFRKIHLNLAMLVAGALIYYRQPGLAAAVAMAYALWLAWPLAPIPLLVFASSGLILSIAPYFLLNTLLTSPTVRVAGMATALLGVMTLALGWGLGVLFFGLLTYTYGIYPGQNDFVKDFGMVVTLFGVVLLLCGWRMMKEVYFAIAFLVCGIPWPGLFYSRVAGPLQSLAAQVAVWTMKLTGVESSAGGTKILIYPTGMNGAVRTLNVAEACAGLRSLMTFISIGGAVAFLSGRPLWQKLLLTFAAIPIAIFCNVMRVSGQGLLDHYVSQQLSESFAHQFVGMIMFVPAFLLILLTGWVLDQIFVEEADIRHSQLTNRVLRRNTTVTAIPAAKPVRPTGNKPAVAIKSATTVSGGGATVAAPVPGRSLAARRAAMQSAARPAVAATAPTTKPLGKPKEAV